MSTPKAKRGYRPLVQGEVIKAGDLTWFASRWQSVDSFRGMIGSKLQPFSSRCCRRHDATELIPMHIRREIERKAIAESPEPSEQSIILHWEERYSAFVLIIANDNVSWKNGYTATAIAANEAVKLELFIGEKTASIIDKLTATARVQPGRPIPRKHSIKPAAPVRTPDQIEHAFATCRQIKHTADDAKRRRGEWNLIDLLAAKRLALVALGVVPNLEAAMALEDES